MAKHSYAQGTVVPVGRSRDEIESTLIRFGATGQLWARDDERGIVVIAFKREGRTYKFTVPLPLLKEFRMTPSGRFERTEKQAEVARETEVRRRFRSLANYVKALLDAIDTGIIQVDEALLPYLVLGSGKTVYEHALQQLEGGQEVDLMRALSSGEPSR